jgi:hypothetical protein
MPAIRSYYESILLPKGAGCTSESVAGLNRTVDRGCARIRPDRLRHQRHGNLGFAVSDGDTVKFGRQRVRQVDYDHKNNRPVATCFAGKDDLQALMVGAGWAYTPSARAAARGVHVHHCQPPWEWRALHRVER